MTTVGIIGFGSFGKFLAEKLDSHVSVRVYSSSGRPNQWAASLEEVAACDYVLLAVPLNAYHDTLEAIKGCIGERTVLVDVCSVKEKPLQIIQSVLPNQAVVATHPLFGPESARDSVAGHTIVLCPEFSDKTAFRAIDHFAREVGLDVVHMSAQEHDKEMAVVHGLTFFIAHALKDLNLHDQQLSTPSFKKLLQLAELEKHHSYELFLTIQAGNKHANAVREHFVKLCNELDTQIDKLVE